MCERVKSSARSFVAFIGMMLFVVGFLLSAQQPTASEEEQKTALAVEALTRLQNVDLEQNPKLKQTVLRVLGKTRGTADFVKLVQQFKLKGQERGLLEAATRNWTNESGVDAIRLVLATGDSALLKESLRGTNKDQAIKTAELLGNASEKSAVPLLLPLAEDAAIDPTLRWQAVRSLAKTSEGATALLGLAKDGKLPEDIKFTAANELRRDPFMAKKRRVAARAG